LIIEKGYKVIPEFPAIGYRIDLVIQGENARLAVECDGDQYHSLEKWEDDQKRESQLRRAGWVFWRLTGSSFYRNKEKALDPLWEKLEKMGIKPTENYKNENQAQVISEQAKVISQSSQRAYNQTLPLETTKGQNSIF
jgi:very-short-patch-repair endonuclease